MYDPDSPSANSLHYSSDSDHESECENEYGEWRQAAGFNTDAFQVSSNGWVIVSHNGKQRPPTRGTLEGKYYRTHYNWKKYAVHRIVCMTFHRTPKPGETVDHINRNTTDNRVSNLRWATKAQQNKNRIIKKNRRTAMPLVPLEPQDDLPGEIWVKINKRVWISSSGRAQRMSYSIDRLGHKFTPVATSGLSYAAISIDGKEQQFHNVVAKAFGMKLREGETIDHIDQNRANNRLDNLRVATKHQQNENRTLKPTGQTHDSLKDPVLGRSLTSMEWELFPSQIGAARILTTRLGTKVDSSAISKVLKGKYKQHKGWTFKTP